MGLRMGIMAMAMMVMLMSTTACRFVHQFHAENIKEQEGEDAGAEPFEPACHFMTAIMGIAQMVGEPLAGQEIVDAEAEKDGTADDGREIEQ